MAEYKINQPSSAFPGHRGSIVIAEPGPFLDAGVISGVLTRLDDPAEEKPELSESEDDEPETSEDDKPAKAPKR